MSSSSERSHDEEDKYELYEFNNTKYLTELNIIRKEFNLNEISTTTSCTKTPVSSSSTTHRSHHSLNNELYVFDESYLDDLNFIRREFNLEELSAQNGINKDAESLSKRSSSGSCTKRSHLERPSTSRNEFNAQEKYGSGHEERQMRQNYELEQEMINTYRERGKLSSNNSRSSSLTSLLECLETENERGMISRSKSLNEIDFQQITSKNNDAYASSSSKQKQKAIFFLKRRNKVTPLNNSEVLDRSSIKNEVASEMVLPRHQSGNRDVSLSCMNIRAGDKSRELLNFPSIVNITKWMPDDDESVERETDLERIVARANELEEISESLYVSGAENNLLTKQQTYLSLNDREESRVVNPISVENEEGRNEVRTFSSRYKMVSVANDNENSLSSETETTDLTKTDYFDSCDDGAVSGSNSESSSSSSVEEKCNCWRICFPKTKRKSFF